MSSVVISGDTSGAITVAAPAVAGTNTITLPAVTGTVVVAGQNSAITQATAQTPTAATSVDFTGIPSYVNRITVMFSGVSTSGTSGIRFQVMVGGTAVTTNYTASSFTITNAISGAVGAATTNGFPMGIASASSVFHGQIILSKISSNAWVGTGNFYDNLATERITTIVGRVISLSSAVDGIRVTTTGGTDTFDAGTINILYE